VRTLLFKNLSSTDSIDIACFFPGDGKFFQGVIKHTICLKRPKNIIFSFKKVEKHTVYRRPARGGGGFYIPKKFEKLSGSQ